MDPSPLRAKILETIVRKSSLKQQVFDNTFATFNELKDILFEMSSEWDDELDGRIDRRVRIEYRDRGKFETQFQVASDLLIFRMHTDVFEFDANHLVWQSPYVQADRDNSYCGIIDIYNFLSDSFKFNRNADEGYLIGRIFINRERCYFVEGKRQTSMRPIAFGRAAITREALVGILETAIAYSLDFDLLTRDGRPVQHQDGQLEVRHGQTPGLRLRRGGHLTAPDHPAFRTMKPICLLFVLPLLGTGCRTEQSAYLEKALSQLERIERVAYRRSSESYLPGDTIPRRYLRHSYLSYYNADDTTRIDGGYDGTIAVDLDHDRREVVIDDFSIPRAPYRLTDMTFFCRAEAILRYVLTTSDPIRTEFTPCGDGYRLRLDIDRDCVVEFWGRPYYNRPPRELFPEAEHSAYEIVFDSERMPRKLRREQTHQITVDSVFDVRIDYEPQAPLRLEAYYPDGYMLRKRKLRNQAKKPYDIVGRQAPDWTLVDADSTAVSLGDLRSRVLLIQFTGIGCGPCHASIPFLRSLEERYTPADVGVVAIETWGTPLRSLGVYVRRNRINYPMLAGTDETVDAYLPDRAVPVYLLVDAERRVRHAFCGYTPAESDRTITEAIDSLLREQ